MLENLEQGDLTFLWTFEFVKELVNNGLRHAVLSPGSRSTPLTMAFAAHPEIQKHVVLDERSAGFMALGIGKASGKPAALVCTSGTAAANYFPAIVESRMSQTPLIVLTADRPPKYRHVGASQAIDQLKLYGDYPVLFFEAGEPVAHENDFERLRWLACQAYQDSVYKNGPVHINLPFRKPLEPSVEFYEEIISKLSENAATKKDSKTHTLTPEPTNNWLSDEIIQLLQKASRPVVIAGPLPSYSKTNDIIDFFQKWNIPVLAESSSQMTNSNYIIRGFDSFLRNEGLRKRLAPDLILRFGHHPIGKGLDLYLQTHKEITSILFLDTDGWLDSTYSTDYVINRRGSFSDIDLSDTCVDSGWMETWIDLSNLFVKKRSEILETKTKLTDGKVYYELISHIPDNWNIFLSNSFPVRDFDLFGTGISKQKIYVSRGASGIDGITSTALGATIESKRNGILFIGDLAFLHDTNALLSSHLLGETTLIVVIINNNGGNIFRMLPVSKHSQIFNPYFQTPQKAKIPRLASSYDLKFGQVTKFPEIVEKFNELKIFPGLNIIECITDPDISMEQRLRIWQFDN